ncbi:MAG: sensor histidine kinase [Halobacteriaceae archaeon]
MVDETRSHASALALAGVAALLAGSYLWFAVLTRPFGLTTVPEGGLALVGPASIAYAAHRLVSDDQWQAGSWTVLKRCLAGVVGAAGVAAAYIASQTVQGVAVSRGFAVVHIAATVGAVGGLVVGFREAEMRQHVDRLESHEETFVFLNNTLRHHVLNSVQVVQGHADAIEDGTVADSIADHCERITDLVQNVGVLAQVLTRDIDTQPVNLSAVVATEVRVCRERWPGADIEADIPSGVRVEADRFLGPVCENLLDNALHHNDKQTPQVEVAAERDGDRVRLRVADNGPGIDDPEAALSRGVHGDEGVGLYLVRTLVEQYGGEVAVADNEPEGTVFTVTLPAAD